MFKWLKSLFFKDKSPSIDFELQRLIDGQKQIDALKTKKRPRLYKQAIVVTTGELPKEKKVAKNGLYANIHAKQERIAKEKAEGKPVEKMRKPGTKGAPTAAAFKAAAKTAKKK